MIREARPPRIEGLSVMVPSLAVAAVLGYAFYVSVARALPPERFAVFGVFWGLTFGAAGIVAGVEQETARAVAAGVARGRRRAATQRRMLVSGLLVAVVLLLVGALAWPLALSRPLDGSGTLGLLAACAVVGVAVQYVARGAYLGLGRTRTYGLLVVAEATLRVAVLTAVVLSGREGLLSSAAAVVAGSFAWLLLGRRVLPADTTDGADEPPPWREALGRTASLSLAAACTSAVVTGFPVIAGAFAGPQDVRQLGIALAALTLTRLPLLLLAPVQALLVPQVVRLVARGGWRLAAPLVHRVWGALVALGAVAVLLAALAGPTVVALVYGTDYRISGPVLAVMTAGAVAVAVLVVLAAALVALQRHVDVTLAWVCCLVGLVSVLAVPVGDFLVRVTAALVVGPLVGLTVAVVALLVATRTGAPSEEPGRSGAAAPTLQHPSSQEDGTP